ncbi:MAG: HDOD domain-containing protein [Candidatus Electryonea clarkiae]|nr:HDOD domain-containing protein [Candidatus Electryonea clarkiae]
MIKDSRLQSMIHAMRTAWNKSVDEAKLAFLSEFEKDIEKLIESEKTDSNKEEHAESKSVEIEKDEGEIKLKDKDTDETETNIKKKESGADEKKIALKEPETDKPEESDKKIRTEKKTKTEKKAKIGKTPPPEPTIPVPSEPKRWLELENRLKNTSKLPVLPTIFLKVINIANDPSSDVDELYKAISSDPSISTEILRLANSAYYGLSRGVKNLRTALVVIGFFEACHHVQSLSVLKTFPKEQLGESFDFDRFWMHSIEVGAIAKTLASFFGMPHPEEFQSAGLLHDIGKIFLATYFGERFAKSINFAKDKDISLWKAEMMLNGTDHARIGGYLAKKWDMPEFIISCIRFHHQDNPDEEFSHDASIVNLANRLSGEIYSNENEIDIRKYFLNDNQFISLMVDKTSLDDTKVKELAEKVEEALKETREFIKNTTS